MNYFLVVTLLYGFLMFQPARAQEIKVGQKMPDMEFADVINYSRPKLKFSDFKGKLVVLDFWGFTCVPCLKAFPDIEAMQKKFEGKVQFILVALESKQRTIDFFSNHKKVFQPNVPIICDEDRRLWKTFPFWGVPFHVWIGPDGIVRQRVNGGYTTAAALKTYLAGGKTSIPQRPSKLVFIKSLYDSNYSSGIKYGSYLSKALGDHIDNRETAPGSFEIKVRSLSAIELYRYALNRFETDYFSRPSTVASEIKDSSLLYPPEDADQKNQWRLNHMFMYHLLVPESQKSRAYEYMKEDLDRYFDLKSRLEKRQVKCLVLVRTSPVNRLATKGDKPRDNFIPLSTSSGLDETVPRSMINKPYRELSFKLRSLLEFRFNTHFLDETGFDKIPGFNIDFTIDARVMDLEKLDLQQFRSALNKYDLDIRIENKTIDVLVLRDAN